MKRALAAMIAVAMMAGAGIAFGANEKPATKPAVKKPTAKAEKPDTSGNITGKVVETMNAGGYTYVCLEKGGKKTWVAVSEMKVAVGETRSFLPGQVMPNFSSKSLGRTFDEIIFSGGPAVASGIPSGHPGTPAGPSGSKAQVAPKEKAVKVGKADGPDAYSVAEVYAKSAALDTKKVTVKGKVVKVSQGIMGRNWVHLQDGTGDAAKGTHNLVTTTQDTASVGDIVTVTGTFRKDKDFGAGYLYKAIIEDATIQK